MAMIEIIFDHNIKSFQNDGGRVFNFLSSKLSQTSLIYCCTCPHTSKKNGVVGSRHRRVLERGLTFLFDTIFDVKYWFYAFRTIVYTLDKLSSKVVH